MCAPLEREHVSQTGSTSLHVNLGTSLGNAVLLFGPLWNDSNRADHYFDQVWEIVSQPWKPAWHSTGFHRIA